MNNLFYTLLNILLKRFDLVWKNGNLYYVKRLPQGDIQVFITKNINVAKNIVGLPYLPNNNFDNIYYCIINSKIFYKKLFILKKTDENIAFLDRLREENPPNRCTAPYKCTDVVKELKKYIKLGPTVLSSIFIANVYDRSKKELRNKFNGNLIKRWAETDNPLKIALYIEEFKLYIKHTYGKELHSFLYHTKPSKIRIEFKVFLVDKYIKEYPTYQNELPF
jgi:hypothetical protein